jgi:transposase-like protein
MVGTPFEKSRTSLQKWFYALFLFTTTRHGVPAKELQRQLGVTYKAAWRMGHEIRKYMAQVDGDPPLGRHVEIDETYIGGRQKKSDGRSNKARTGRGTTNKQIVFGMVERRGDVISRHVPDVSADTLIPHVLANVEPKSTINSDEWRSYSRLGEFEFRFNMRHDPEWMLARLLAAF